MSAVKEKKYKELELFPGARLEAKDYTDKWYPVRIVEMDMEEREVLIHFEKWSSRYDEWIKMDSDRLRPRKEPVKQKLKKREFNIGDKVLAPWTDNRKYPAELISKLSDGLCEIIFFDGFKKIVRESMLCEVSTDKIDKIEFHSSPILPPLKKHFPDEANNSENSLLKQNKSNTTCSEFEFLLSDYDQVCTKEERRQRSRKLIISELLGSHKQKRQKKEQIEISGNQNKYESLHICYIDDCKKDFHNAKLLQMHIKHSHLKDLPLKQEFNKLHYENPELSSSENQNVEIYNKVKLKEKSIQNDDSREKSKGLDNFNSMLKSEENGSMEDGIFCENPMLTFELDSDESNNKICGAMSNQASKRGRKKKLNKIFPTKARKEELKCNQKSLSWINKNEINTCMEACSPNIAASSCCPVEEAQHIHCNRNSHEEIVSVCGYCGINKNDPLLQCNKCHCWQHTTCKDTDSKDVSIQFICTNCQYMEKEDIGLGTENLLSCFPKTKSSDDHESFMHKINSLTNAILELQENLCIVQYQLVSVRYYLYYIQCHTGFSKQTNEQSLIPNETVKDGDYYTNLSNKNIQPVTCKKQLDQIAGVQATLDEKLMLLEREVNELEKLAGEKWNYGNITDHKNEIRNALHLFAQSLATMKKISNKNSYT